MSKLWSARVLNHDFLAADVRRLTLEKPEQAPNFYAGQYLQLIVDYQHFPFSIASAPQTNQLELHIKPTVGSGDSLTVEQYLNQKPTSVDFTYPHGNCLVDSVPECPVILIAAATGVTQMRSIALWLLAQPKAPTVSLFWGTLTPEELYLSDELESLAASNHRFQYFPVVSQSGGAWSGRQGLVVNAAIEDCEDLSSADIYISGSPTMVYGTLDRLVEQGVNADRVSADVFDYAPRK